MADWYYVSEGQSVGPIDEAALIHLFRNGLVTFNTLVWQAAFADWMPLQNAGLNLNPTPPKPVAAVPIEPEPPAPAPVSAPVQQEPPKGSKLRLASHVTTQAVPPPATEEGATTTPKPVRAVIWPVDRALGSTQVSDPEFRFDGTGKELLKLYLKNILLTVLTLGIYRFWAQANMKRFRNQHTTLAGGRFDFHGTGLEKLTGFLKGMLILLPPAGGIFWALHTQWENVNPAILFVVASMIVLLVLRPMMMVGSWRYNLSRTSWNGLRFRFDGKVRDAYILYTKDMIFTVCTVGIYWTWHQVNLKRFQAEHSRMGTTTFAYSGTGSELWSINLKGYLLSLITGGIYQPWWFANAYNYHLDRTTFGSAFFNSKITGASVIWNLFLATLLIIGTLGLAFPWVMVRYYRFFTDHLNMFTDMDVDTLRASVDTKASSLADGLTEVGEAIESVGDIFT